MRSTRYAKQQPNLSLFYNAMEHLKDGIVGTCKTEPVDLKIRLQLYHAKPSQPHNPHRGEVNRCKSTNAPKSVKLIFFTVQNGCKIADILVLSQVPREAIQTNKFCSQISGLT